MVVQDGGPHLRSSGAEDLLQWSEAQRAGLRALPTKGRGELHRLPKVRATGYGHSELSIPSHLPVTMMGEPTAPCGFGGR
jgi:hypothetical protein